MLTRARSEHKPCRGRFYSTDPSCFRPRRTTDGNTNESLAEPEGDLDTPIVEQAEIETSGARRGADKPGEEPLGEDAGSDEDETSSQDESAGRRARLF